MKRQPARKNRFTRIEILEERMCLAASVGWDGAGRGSAALTYYLGAVPASVGLSAVAVETAVETALAAWSKAAAITFTQTQTPNLANSIDFQFRSIDGRNGTLAQAYFPGDVNRSSIAGDVQFDVAEAWEVGNGRGNAATDLVFVAAHEIGHALGLEHSSVAGSIMAPSVSSNRQFTSLPATDATAIQRLYATPGNSTTPTTPAPPTTPTAPPTTTTPAPRIPTSWWAWNNFVQWWQRYGGRIGHATASETASAHAHSDRLVASNDVCAKPTTALTTLAPLSWTSRLS